MLSCLRISSVISNAKKRHAWNMPFGSRVCVWPLQPSYWDYLVLYSKARTERPKRNCHPQQSPRMRIVPRSESFGQINEVQIARNIWCRQVWDPSIHPFLSRETLRGDWPNICEFGRILLSIFCPWGAVRVSGILTIHCCSWMLKWIMQVKSAWHTLLITIQDHWGAPLELLVLKSEMLGIRVWHDVRPCRRTLNVYDVYDVLSRSLRCFASMGRGM